LYCKKSDNGKAATFLKIIYIPNARTIVYKPIEKRPSSCELRLCHNDSLGGNLPENGDVLTSQGHVHCNILNPKKSLEKIPKILA